MTTQASFNLKATQGIEMFARQLGKFGSYDDIAAFVAEAPVELTDGKTLEEIGMEDLLVSFELIYGERVAHETPLNIYQALLRHVEPDREIDTVEKLEEYRSNRKARSVAAKAAYEKGLPRFIEILKDKADITEIEDLAQAYVNLLSTFTEAGIENSLQNAFSKNADIQHSVKDTIEALYAEEDARFEESYEIDGANKEAATVATTQLSKASEEIINTFGKDLRNVASKKHLARTDFAKENKIKLTGDNLTPVDESLLNVATTLLMTPTQSNMIMVGEKGMDTSGIITRIAEQLLHDKVPEQIGGGRIIELDLQKMTMYAPKEMATHLNQVFTDIDNHNKAGKPPLFVSLKGFEKAVRPKSIIAAPLEDFFSYWLGETKNVRIIAEVSQYGLDNIKTDAPDLYKLLNLHTLKETNQNQTIARMQDWLYFGRGKALSDKYKIGQAIIESAVTLSNKHVNKESIVQPGLTVSILELAVTAAEKRGSKDVTQDDVIEAVMTASGKARDIIETKSNEKLATLNEFVKSNLISQDHAIDSITKKTDLMRMGRKRKDKPIGVFMLTGPTGVGKTETAKLIAQHLGAGLTTVDMSNYTHDNTISQILGSPAGYVGYGETTPLEAVADHDINVVLLDEFEKSHPTIYKAFMSSFDEGRMTLRTNKKLDFSNTLFLLTSNAGQKDKELVRKPTGFNDETVEDMQAKAQKEAINSILAPEYQGRIDEIIDYNGLDKDAIETIAKLKIAKLEKRIADERQHGALKINPKAFNELVEQGFGKGLGARPLERAIENLIDLPLGQWCLNNQDKDPMDYKFTVKSISPDFKLAVTPLKAAPKVAATNDNTADVTPKKAAPKAAIK